MKYKNCISDEVTLRFFTQLKSGTSCHGELLLGSFMQRVASWVPYSGSPQESCPRWPHLRSSLCVWNCCLLPVCLAWQSPGRAQVKVNFTQIHQKPIVSCDRHMSASHSYFYFLGRIEIQNKLQISALKSTRRISFQFMALYLGWTWMTPTFCVQLPKIDFWKCDETIWSSIHL